MPYTHKDVDVVVRCDTTDDSIAAYVHAGPYLVSVPIVCVEIYEALLRRLVAFSIIDDSAHTALLVRAPHCQIPATYKEARHLAEQKLPLIKRIKHALTERRWELKKAGRDEEIIAPKVDLSTDLLDGCAGCSERLGTFRYFIAFLDAKREIFMTTHRGTVRDNVHSLRRLVEDCIITSTLYNRLLHDLVKKD